MAQEIHKLRFGWLRKILRDGREYLDRYSLTKPLEREHGDEPSIGRVCYVHHLRDVDRGELHNHPWDWSLSIVLWGWYDESYASTEPCDECTPNAKWFGYSCEKCGTASFQDSQLGRTRKRRVRFWNWLPSAKYHRIERLAPRGCVTLFIAGRTSERRRWGFWVEGRGHVDAAVLRAERKAARA
jgi:hypothetical protein